MSFDYKPYYQLKLPHILTLLLFGVIAIGSFGCNRSNKPPTAENRTPMPGRSNDGSIPSPSAKFAKPPAGAVLAIDTVGTVILNQQPSVPEVITIQAVGKVASGGWTSPKLEPVVDTTGDVRIRSFKFVASSPSETDTGGGPQNVAAELRVGALPDSVKRIRVFAAKNEVWANVTPPIVDHSSK